MMNAVNPVDRHTYGFEEKVWPVALKKNVGLVAMKVFGGAVSMKMSNSKLDAEHHDMAFRYALSQPGVACAVIGMATRDELLQNVERAKRFKPLTETEMAQILATGKQLAANWGAHYGAVA
jgi:predicted aldo/keto reductase-like oxidoreductase